MVPLSGYLNVFRTRVIHSKRRVDFSYGFIEMTYSRVDQTKMFEYLLSTELFSEINRIDLSLTGTNYICTVYCRYGGGLDLVWYRFQNGEIMEQASFEEVLSNIHDFVKEKLLWHMDIFI